MKDVDYYGPADEAIRQMDRDNLRAFSRLKLADFDKISIIRVVLNLYETQARKARKKYREMAMEAYLLALMMAEERRFTEKAARSMAEKAITEDWIDSLMAETDFVTLYRFNTETERKAQRLIEALAAAAEMADGKVPWGSPAETRNTLIDQALKAWTKQLGQYAISVTDAAVVQAMADVGIRWVMWMTERDQRVCHECRLLDGRVFPIDEVPTKPHWGCRCRLAATGKPKE